MNILYYIPDVHQGMGGLRQYAVALLKLLASDHEHRYFVQHDSNDPEVLEIMARHAHLRLVRSPRRLSARLRTVNKAVAIYKRATNRAAKDSALISICRANRIDVIHCPYQYLPEAPGIPSICTMHDVQELLFPEYFTAEDRAHRAVHYLKYIRNAAGVIVSYEHIKQDLLKYFKPSPDRVHVCFLNMSDLWLNRFTGTDPSPLTTLQVPRDFFLYPANTWAHKNHLRILEALVLLNKRGTRLHFIFTGHKTDLFENVLRPFIAQNDLNDQVSFLGVVEEAVLYSLYKNCRGVVVPTYYEAGSFPLMEAMLLSVPVICSNVTSLPSTIGDPEFVFDPADVEELAGKMMLLNSDGWFRQKNLKNSMQQARKLRTPHALADLKAVYSKVV